jgi:hypothetical protein
MAAVNVVEIRKSLKSFMSGFGIPGHWWIWKAPVADVVLVCCPQCRHMIDITESYTILNDGIVTPACKCPTSYCEFKGPLKLLDWVPRIQKVSI